MHSGRSCGVSDPILKHAFLAGGAPIRKRWFLHTYRRKCVLVDLQDEQYTRIYTQIHDNIQQVVSSLLAYNTLIQQRLFETYGRQEAEVTVNVPLPPDEHLKKLFAPMIRSTVDGTNVRMLFWLKHAFAMLAPTFLARVCIAHRNRSETVVSDSVVCRGVCPNSGVSNCGRLTARLPSIFSTPISSRAGVGFAMRIACGRRANAVVALRLAYTAHAWLRGITKLQFRRGGCGLRAYVCAARLVAHETDEAVPTPFDVACSFST